MNEILNFSIIILVILMKLLAQILNISETSYEVELTILLIVMLLIVLSIICLTIIKKAKDK